MKIAIQGCCHGELDKIYATLEHIQQTQQIEIDLLLICGDFQALRNHADLKSLACPEKFRRLGVFHEYYRGTKKAPIPTIFVGGNHEASNYLWELYHGGWVCPNIYFLGYANVIRFNGLRIGGISGIFKREHYEWGFHEKYPYNDNALRSIYHVRKHNIDRLSQIKTPIHIFLSHDWPLGIVHHGNTRALLARKKHFQQEVERNELGSPPLATILDHLRPSYWFAAHLHVKFAALYFHTKKSPDGGIPKKEEPTAHIENPEAIDIDVIDSDDDEEEEDKGVEKNQNEETNEINHEQESSNSLEQQAPTEPSPNIQNETIHEETSASSSNSPSHEIVLSDTVFPPATRFLALDKCLPGKHFLQVVDIPFESNESGFQYDPEWLAVVKATASSFSKEKQQKPLPDPQTLDDLIKSERAVLETMAGDSDDFWDIPHNFVPTAPPHDPENAKSFDTSLYYRNPQTDDYCNLIQIENVINVDGQTPFQATASS